MKFSLNIKRSLVASFIVIASACSHRPTSQETPGKQEKQLASQSSVHSSRFQ